MRRGGVRLCVPAHRFPRVSGDAPVLVAGNLAAGVFSPRERGCAPPAQVRDGEVRVFPA